MEKINDLFDQEITKTVDAYPSILSKNDVCNLLSSLRTEVLTEVSELKPTGSTYDVNAINRAVADIIDNIDFDEYIYLNLNYGFSYGSSFSLELNNSLDAYQFSRQMETELTDYFNDLDKK